MQITGEGEVAGESIGAIAGKGEGKSEVAVASESTAFKDGIAGGPNVGVGVVAIKGEGEGEGEGTVVGEIAVDVAREIEAVSEVESTVTSNSGTAGEGAGIIVTEVTSTGASIVESASEIIGAIADANTGEVEVAGAGTITGACKDVSEVAAVGEAEVAGVHGAPSARPVRNRLTRALGV